MTNFTYDPTQPLKKQPGESRKANAALWEYWKMGGGRSLARLLERFLNQTATNPQPNSPPPAPNPPPPPTRRLASLKTWSCRFAWQSRVEQAEKLRREEETRLWAERRSQVREDDWKLAEELRSLAVDILKESPKFIKTTRRYISGKENEPDREIITITLDANLAIKASEAASKLARLAAGMETEAIDVAVGEDLEAVRVKRWAQIAGVLKQAQLSDAGAGADA